MATPQELNTLTTQFYNANPAQEDEGLREHRIEFEVTLRTILRRLPPGGTRLKILDIGGGTGPYSFALATHRHSVTLIDLSPGLLALARARSATLLPSQRPARILEGDATALSDALPEAERGTFDVVLLLGPLYHIMSAELRERGGTMFCAWVSRWAHYRDVAMRGPGRLAAKRDFYAKHAEDGDYVRYDEDGEPCHAMHHEMSANMPVILQRVTGEEGVQMVGAEGVLAGDLDKLVNELQGEQFEAWVEKCLEVGTDEQGWMMSDHMIGVVSKTARAL